MKIAAKNRSTMIAWIAWFILSLLGFWAFYTIFPGPDVYGCG
jgi:Mn2+/Fe2+ NRAMP family transporter